MTSRAGIGAAALAAALFASPAIAQDYYASVSAGAAWLDDSSNSGAFNSAFTTGAGTTIPAGTVLPVGTPVGWNTEFDNSYALSVAVGRNFGSKFRAEIELSRQTNDVDTHTGVRAADIPLGAEDAGVLITGSSNLGVTVADLVADGRGEIEATYLMANLFLDFKQMGPIQPYVGAGLGAGFVDVTYAPSGVGIVSDDATVLAYQLIAGASFPVGERMSIFAQYRYRATEDIETQVQLFDASLDVENASSLLEAGVRFRF